MSVASCAASRRRRRARGALAGALAGLAMANAHASPATAVSRASTGDGAVTLTKSVSRGHVVDGREQAVESKDVTLTVPATKSLRSRQVVTVTWKGAHPTGGIYPDPNSADARKAEYPFVLMECRGVDDPAASATARLTPQTCWTQSPDERFVDDYNTDFPPYRLDRYATPADRTAIAGRPAGAADCSSGKAQHWVPFRSASGTTYAGGPGGCAGTPPESTSLSTTGRPGNTTYGTTLLDGSGSADFSIWTSEDNASLGCSDTVACALVAVPIMGISCDPAATGLPDEDRPPEGRQRTDATTVCTATGKQQVGAQATTGSPLYDQTVTGALWWSESNWRNRITVPLGFAPLANVCDLVTQQPESQIYGSELVAQATSQWGPALCTARDGYKIKHVQTGEPQARNLVLTGTANAAFLSLGPTSGWTTPTVSAPTALTGFALSYTVDDRNGNPVADLKMTPRLLAKLLTESYPAIGAIKEKDAALAANPLDVAKDPEFQALNPSVSPDLPAEISASTALILSSDSDVIRALSTYIDADPDAHAWLAGQPDPWGVKVNPAYQTGGPRAALTLPTDSWPLLDQFEPKDYYAAGNQCLQDNPVPYLPLVAAPTQRLSSIALAMQYSLANSQVVCSQVAPGSAGAKLVSLGRQSRGYRFLLGLTSLADARRYSIPAASLLSYTSPAAQQRFSDGQGRTFVSPTDDAVTAAARLLKPDDASGTWTLSPGELRADSAAADAYPGTMLVSTAVPTQGLPADEAGRLAAFLRFVAGPAQTPGFGIGQLPPGYVPLGQGTGTAALAAYTAVAADAVAAQRGDVPPLLPVSATAAQVREAAAAGVGQRAGAPRTAATPRRSDHAAIPPRTPSVPTAGSSQRVASPAATSTPTGTTVASAEGGSGSTSTAAVPRPSATPAPQGVGSVSPGARLASSGTTPGASAGIAGVALPLALAVTLLGALGAGAAVRPRLERTR